MDLNSKSLFIRQQANLQQQPDTLDAIETIRSPKSDIDSTDAPQGINKLFLEIERRSIEIEKLKEEQSQPKVVRVVKPKVQVDTTCHICPKGKAISLFQIAEQQQGAMPFMLQPLRDKEFYNTAIAQKGPVFIETQNSIENTHTSHIVIKLKPPAAKFQNWVIFPTLSILLLLIYIKIYYSKNLSAFIRGGFFYFIAKRLATEDSLPWFRLSMLLDLLYFISVSLSLSLFMNHLGIIPNNHTPLEVFLLSIIILVGFRLFRYFSLKVISFVSNRPKDIHHLHFNLLLYVRIFSLLLAPIVVLFAYANTHLATPLLFLSATLLSITLVYRAVRTFQVFLNKGFSLFYLIMYLCTFEILPVLLLAKIFF